MANKTTHPKHSARHTAGRETALADFRAGRLSMPTRSDAREWARGYAECVAELAGTFGHGRIAAMGGAL